MKRAPERWEITAGVNVLTGPSKGKTNRPASYIFSPPPMIPCSPVIAIVGTLALASAAQAAFPPDQIEFFEKSIRPLLAEHCYDCHGATKHENGLRLDTHEGALLGSEYGKVIEPGNPAASKLIKAVKHQGGVEPMPKKERALKPEDIALLEKWIGMGVPWPEEKAVAQAGSKPKWQEHWSFLKVAKPAVPALTGAPVRNPIDAFVLAKLKAAGLKPAPPADAATLCRRLYLTVTGLLPSFEQVEAFKQAASRNRQAATGALVDQLLCSPHYGERWGRYWLDIARYSDTEGYQVGGKVIRYPYAYTYRDWVVNALNQDMPYDQFLTCQLAADKVLDKAPADSEAAKKNLAALGFLTVGDTFIGNGDLQTDDRIDVTARGMLGLSVGCARCHDHKYDPIPSKDYYALYSIFNSSRMPDELPVIGKPMSDTAFASFKGEVAKVENKMAGYRKVLYDDMRNPEKMPEYLAFLYEARNKKLENEGFRGRCGQLHLRDRVAVKWRSLIQSAAFQGTPSPVLLAWKEFSLLEEDQFAAQAAVVVNNLQSSDSHCNREIAEAFRARTAPANFNDVAATYAGVFLKHLSPVGAKDEVNALLMRDPSPLAISVDDMEQFFTRQDFETMVRMKNEMKVIEITNAGAPPRAMVMNDRPKPADVHVFIRGNPGRPGPLAPRANLTLLGGQAFTDGSGRLELARAITSLDNPLTARVLVNRAWMAHFGKPLVSTPSDLGMQAPKPEQALLLDYLAATFMEEGWSLKKLHRLILTSSTWQQSCQTTPEKETKDAENSLLSRFNRTRLDYEAMRDAVAKVADILNIGAMGGRSVPLTAADVDSHRAVYQYVDRYDQATVPATFDFANPDNHSSQRFVTTVPQQALFLMNSPYMKKQSETLAARLPREPTATADSETIKALYHRVLQRDPKLAEVELAQRFVADAETLAGPPTFLWTYGTAHLKREGDAATLTGWQPFEVLTEPFKTPTWSHTGITPDPKWQYAFLTASGGHAPADDLVVSRRWQAPFDGTFIVRGTLKRPAKVGNGVRGLIMLNGKKVLREALADPAKPSQPMALADGVALKKGDVLDFALSAENGDTNSDSFEWAPEIQLPAKDGDKPQVLTNAKADFCGKDGWPLTRARPQSALAQLVQVLLMSNEFMFVE